MWDFLSNILVQFAPIVIGLATAPVMSGIKSVAHFVDERGPLVQRLMVGGIALGLTEASNALNLALPTGLDALTPTHVGAAVATGIALAVHKAKK